MALAQEPPTPVDRRCLPAVGFCGVFMVLLAYCMMLLLTYCLLFGDLATARDLATASFVVILDSLPLDLGSVYGHP